jgi:serine phosphatase RsbU (regulator of sigma subunit)
LYKPKDIVSGDFYWIHEESEKVFIAVADCTGHGVSGAFVSLMGHNLLNEIINENPNFNPSEILFELNNKILNTLKQNSKKTSAKYGMDVALISIIKQNGSLEYAGAHNPLLIFRGKECFQLKANQRSIGSYKKEGQPGFTNQNFQLLKGDMLYMFSDGYVDQIGGPENKKMFPQPFRDLLQSICRLEMTEQKKILDETIANWKGKQNQTDDILIAGIRF